MEEIIVKSLSIGAVLLSLLVSIITKIEIFIGTIMLVVLLSFFGVERYRNNSVSAKIRRLRERIRGYRPSQWTMKDAGDGLKRPTKARLGVFGVRDSGKSSFLNSLHFAFKGGWENVYVEKDGSSLGGETIFRDPARLSDYVTTFDTRGLVDFSVYRVPEVIAEITGKRGFFTRSKTTGEEIDCPIFIVRYSSTTGIRHCKRFLETLVPGVRKQLGAYPIMVITFADRIADRSSILRDILSSSLDKRSVFFIENYTAENHEMNIEKHIALLKILEACILRADDNIIYKRRKERDSRNKPSWWSWFLFKIRVITEAKKSDYDNLPEKAQRDETDNVESIDHVTEGSSASGNVGALGGKLSTKPHGFTLHIPPGALEEDTEISLRVLTEIPEGLTLKEDELLVSHGFLCYPSGLCFKKPAKLIIPHCALVTAPNKVQTILYSWNQSGTPQRLPDSSNFICSVQERWLEVSVSHFSGGFIALIWDWVFLKGILLSCMSFLPRRLPLSRKTILEVRFVKKLNNQEWDDVHALQDPFFIPVKGDDDEIVFGWRSLAVTCKLGEESPKSDKQTIQYKEMRFKRKVTMYFPLDLTKEIDETLVTLEVIQTSTEKIKFYTSFQGIGKRFTEHDTHSPSTVEAPTEESREDDFDGLLKKIASRINNDIDIDSLGVKLRFEPSEIQRYMQANRTDNTVTYMGTLRMLRDWRNRTNRSEEREKLKKALNEINHQRLADDLLNDETAI